jgi:hypothetical protein
MNNVNIRRTGKQAEETSDHRVYATECVLCEVGAEADETNIEHIMQHSTTIWQNSD